MQLREKSNAYLDIASWNQSKDKHLLTIKKEEIYWCNFTFTLAEVTGLFLWSYCLSPARAEHLNPLQSKQSASLHEFLSNSPSYGLRIEGILKCLASSRAGTTSNYFHESLNGKILKNHTELICSQKIKDITYHSTFFFAPAIILVESCSDLLQDIQNTLFISGKHIFLLFKYFPQQYAILRTLEWSCSIPATWKPVEILPYVHHCSAEHGTSSAPPSPFMLAKPDVFAGLSTKWLPIIKWTNPAYLILYFNSNMP